MHQSKWAETGRGPGAPRRDFNGQSQLGFTTPNPGQGDQNGYLGNMTVCSFYPRNACKFGDACKFEHPGSARDAARGGGGFGGGSNNNRFSAFNGDRYRPSDNSGTTSFGGSRDSKASNFNLDKDAIQADLSKERPTYPLSCYGPGKDAPRQLIEGPVEISPEELRFRYYTLRAAGNEPTAQQEEGALNEKMQQQVKAILDDVTGAINYVQAGADVHPNRIDIAKGTASASGSMSNTTGSSNTAANPFMKAPSNPFQAAAASSQPSAFGQASTPGFGKPAFGQPSNPAQTTSAFGQPSNPGQTTSAFGQPSNPGQTTSAFGQASNPGQTTSAFGQASNPGQTTSAFGQASNPGQSASPFGQASALGQKPSPFGQPSALGGAGSAFGKPAFGASGFGQPSMPGAGSAFGQTSNIGQGSAFGQPSAPRAASGFGQANALGQKPNPFSKPGFGQSGFGQTSQPGANASPFAQQASSGASPFGQQASSGPSPFGQQAQQTSQSSPFGQPAQQTAQPSPFGQQGQQAQKPNSFGQPQQATTQAPAQANPFGGAASSQTPAFGQASKPSPFVTQQPQNNATQPAAANPFLKPQTSAAPATSTSSPFATQAQNQSSNVPTPAQATSQLPSIAQPTSAARPHVEGVTPDGKPIDPKDRYKEGKPEEYDGEQGRILEEIYKRVSQLGRFNDDEDIPVTPPKCEWIAPLTLL
ncbi:uncharacterized protein ALTATR162_LOCUS2009 [Alternaria atra]|uniref:C3H1-type domain-containing protein n=1 Tax=Alternaria atra TaxID=119953 RepID=A0A8J2HX97_9PLEO|nr:uncharacterized protein ALTATR162_LOCUS2009 [Alternaria atra]CAG5147262.1 unnamed protein product [Alternaria atra]